MTPPPVEVVQWLRRTYPRPTVDPEWLEGCYSWIEEEHHLNPARDMPAILEHVNTQLLESSFADSMVAGTGFPENVFTAEKALLKGPILVEMTDIMEIGHSAYSLMQTYESREEYRKQTELRNARGDGDGEERKPMPKYPRSMLKLQLSDGVVALSAIEHKKLPELELGETPLGCKMILRNVTIRKGIAFLNPDCVEFLGHQTADRDEQRDAVFLRALKQRLGEPIEDEPAPAPAPEPAPAEAPAQDPAPAPRSALREISPPSDAAGAGPSESPRRQEREHDDDAAQPRRRKRPSRVGRSPSPDPPPRDLVLARSRYFSKPASDGPSSAPNGRASAGADDSEDAGRVRVDAGDASAMQSLARAIGLSQPRVPAVAMSDARSSDSDDENPFAPRAASKGKGKGKAREEPVTFGEPGSEDYGFDFDLDDSFLEQVSRAEQEALLRDAARSQQNVHSQTQVQAQTQTQVKAEPRSQSAGRTFLATAATATAVGTQRTAGATGRGRNPSTTPAPGSRAGSAVGGPGTSSDVPMDVIDISEDEVEGDKENVPVPTRHVRRRVAPRADQDVIELSD